jgi:Dolichyl-phosphate-mannose-protein mannosyltransferase
LATDARAVSRSRAIPAGAWLVAVVAVSGVVWAVLARRMVAPWIMVDELLYSELAKSFAASGSFAVRGVPDHGLGFVYPVLISPAFRASSVVDAYTYAKALNAELMSLAAVPAYFLARRVASTGLSLVAAALTVAVPSMLYTGTLMTENAFYPLFVLVALVLVMTLERPTVWNQVLLLGLCGLAFLTRAQAVALVPAVVTAPILFDRKRLASFRLLFGLVGTAVVTVAGYELFRGRSIQSALGAYQAATNESYDPATVFRWLVYHVAELDLYVGIAPFAALILLALSWDMLWAPGRALVAGASSLVFWLVLEVSIFASSPSVSRIEERNMFYVAPLFFVALVAWIDRGLPRGRPAAVAAVVAAALPGAIPFAGLINGNATSDTLAFLPWWSLQDTVITLDQVAAVAVLCSLGMAVVFLLVSPRWAFVLPVLLVAYFGATVAAAETNDHGGVRHASVGSLYGGITLPDREWVDHAVGSDANVAFLWTGARDKNTLWQNEFFNRSIGPVYDLHAPAPGGLPSTRVTVDPANGDFLGARPAQYLLTDDGQHVFGREVARDAGTGLVLYRIGGRIQRSDVLGGVYADSWSRATATYTRYECEGGSLRVVLQSDATLFSVPQTVTAGGRRVRLQPGGTGVLTVPLKPRDGRCSVGFAVEPTAVPALAIPGSTDTRRLGVRFTRVDYRP